MKKVIGRKINNTLFKDLNKSKDAIITLTQQHTLGLIVISELLQEVVKHRSVSSYLKSE